MLNAKEVTLATGKEEVKASIPIPDARHELVQYEELYKDKNWKQPATNVRYSAELEESTGCPYTLNDDDLDWIAAYNTTASEPIEEDDLEWILHQLETIANRRLRCKVISLARTL